MSHQFESNLYLPMRCDVCGKHKFDPCHGEPKAEGAPKTICTNCKFEMASNGWIKCPRCNSIIGATPSKSNEHHWLGITEENGYSMPMCVCGWKRIDSLEASMAMQIDAFAEHVATARLTAEVKAEGAEKNHSAWKTMDVKELRELVDALESSNAELQRKGEELCHVLGGLGIHIHELGLRSVGEMGQWKFRNERAEKAEREVERLKEKLELSKSAYDTNLRTSDWNHQQDRNEWDNDRFALEEKLKAMIEDRNLWQDAHNEDCPNLLQLKERNTAQPLNDWHEDMGVCLWWTFPIQEPPYVGDPLCDDWPGMHTHFTRLTNDKLPTPPDTESDEK